MSLRRKSLRTFLRNHVKEFVSQLTHGLQIHNRITCV
uniref:Uncharacterized protein n=1 Tax=Arundo donax TaxID=35708 RepID=A0A0A9FEA6_ARUDO